MDDVEDFDFEDDSKIVGGIFLKLNTNWQESNWPWQHLWKTWNCALPSFLLNLVSCSHGLWKKTLYLYLENLCHIPQKWSPSCLNDYHLIALTSIVMKCFECIILRQLVKRTKPHLDPYQFAYKHNRSTECATLFYSSKTNKQQQQKTGNTRVKWIPK